MWITREVFETERLTLLKRELMLKCGLTAEEVDSGIIRNQEVHDDAITVQDMQGRQLPQIFVELSQALQTLKDHRFEVKQLETELQYSQKSIEKVNKLESLYTLERSYIQQLFKVAEKLKFEQAQVEQTILMEQISQLYSKVIQLEINH